MSLIRNPFEKNPVDVVRSDVNGVNEDMAKQKSDAFDEGFGAPLPGSQTIEEVNPNTPQGMFYIRIKKKSQ